MVEMLKTVDELRSKGKAAEALAALEKAPKAEQNTAPWQYARGRALEDLGRYDDALTAYEAALAKNDKYRAARLRLAFLADLRGDEATALKCYETCVEQWPRDVLALLNLGTLYEEYGFQDPTFYEKAVQCYRQVLAFNPNHPRARLGLRDAQATKNMFYDEEQERRRDKRNQVMEIPITDFELSVRSRNCLRKMNVFSLGDLVMHTEADLLAYKNFGETSLSEIKIMLTSKNLRLGQMREDANTLLAEPEAEVAPEATVNEGVSGTPLSQIEFSVRSRKALERLGVKTLGDLANKTETELMACRNFGQTSLNEVQQRLAEYGMRLREG
jgi:DNA-directed RNA polymerase subunit alpha